MESFATLGRPRCIAAMEERSSGGKMLDKNGKTLKVGDVVTVRGKVVHISEQTSGRNMNVETLEDLPGAENPSTKSHFAIASSQAELAEPEADPVAAPASTVYKTDASAEPSKSDEEESAPASDEEQDKPSDEEKEEKHSGGRGKSHGKKAGH
jgi:hypothetical protein